MQGSRVGRRPPRAVIQNPTHRLPAIMSLRDSLSVKFKQTILGIGALRIFHLNFQLLRLRFMRTHGRERRPNPGMLAKINRALALVALRSSLSVKLKFKSANPRSVRSNLKLKLLT